VTELVIGKSMREYVLTSAPVTPVMLFQLIRKIADGIAHCHDHGIIHRISNLRIFLSPMKASYYSGFRTGADKKSYRVTVCKSEQHGRYAGLHGAGNKLKDSAETSVRICNAVGIMFFRIAHRAGPVLGRQYDGCYVQHLHAVIPRWTRDNRILRLNCSSRYALFGTRSKDRYSDLHAFIHDLDNLNDVDISVLEKSRTPKALSLWNVFLSSTSRHSCVYPACPYHLSSHPAIGANQNDPLHQFRHPTELLALAEEHKIKFIDLQFTDINVL